MSIATSPPSSRAADGGRLELLDYGRFFAALAVMSFHYFFNGIHNGKLSSLTAVSGIVDVAKYGYLGVEFFFMISGYVIFFSSRGKTAGAFAVSRIQRLFPAFWVAVVFTTLVAQYWGGGQMAVSATQAMVNLTMLPGLFGQGFVDGVYWTLQLELGFYALVLFVLLCGWQAQLERLFLLWPWLMLLAKLAGMSHLPFAGGYYSYFSAGALMAMLKTRRDPALLASSALSLALCLLYSTGKAPMLSLAKGQPYSAAVIGSIVVALFCFFALLNTPRGGRLALPGSALAGGLTYPIYLIHAHFGYMALSRFASDDTRVLAYAATFVTVLTIAGLIHLIVEKRLAPLWRRVFTMSVGIPLDALATRLQSALRGLRRPANAE